VINNITYYEEALGSKPYIFALNERFYSEFPTTRSIEIIERDIVPYVRACVSSYFSNSPSFDLKEMAQGKYDNYIQQFAKGAAEFGREHGGFLFTTMEEINGGWYDWGKNSHFINAWRHAWQIFEDKGANQYATWVWEISTPERFLANQVHDPELYYSGDQYIDWIGLNAFSVSRRKFSNGAFHELIDITYREMLKKHPQKPIMQSELARTNSDSQSK
jgi:beta-mannanase